jgi:hypothetical protein
MNRNPVGWFEIYVKDNISLERKPKGLSPRRCCRPAGGSASPKILASVSPSRPPVLPVKDSRSYEVAWIRYRSFCDSGCGLAAQDAWNPWPPPACRT